MYAVIEILNWMQQECISYQRECRIINFLLKSLLDNPVDYLQVPFATQPNHLIMPMAGLGFGIGMVDSSMMPELGNICDIRHSNVYGGVYAIGDIAFCLGFAIGA